MNTYASRLGRILYYLMVVLLGLVAIGALAGVAGLIMAVAAPEHWPAASTLRVDAGPAVTLDTTGLRIAACLFVIGAMALGALVLVPLIGLLRSAATANPFVVANVRRLQIIAAAFASVTAIQIVAPLLASGEVATLLDMEGMTVEVGPVMMALILLVLSEVFREGLRLREDAEGTI